MLAGTLRFFKNGKISKSTVIGCATKLCGRMFVNEQLFCLCFRFCVGDKFFLKNNMILCQMDYEEGQLNGSFEPQVQ